MAMHVALTHTTTYRYDKLIGMGPQVVRLKPAPHCRTPILSYSITIEPKTHFLNWQQDPFGNFHGRVVMPEKTDLFSVTVDLVADMAVINPFDFFIEESAEKWPFAYDELLTEELSPYLKPEKPGAILKKYLAGVDRTPRRTVDFLCDLNMRLQRDISYLVRMEAGVQTPEDTLKLQSGSCRDSAWLLVQILRNLGLAARFVSGYLIQLKPDVASREGPAGTAVDFTDLHAWAEVYVPGAGWIGLDATSGLLAGEGHIPLAATPHPQSAAPITGGHEPAEVEFAFNMGVTRVLETPRVTKPYREETWEAILAGGRAVDERLAAGDVRLSMGGEPTFVAADDMEADEWNTAALGPTKRTFAEDLVRRMQERLAPGALLHYGQGKWYPGEPLPRWAFAAYWRTDGKPLWRDPSLIARENPDCKATVADAQAFSTGLSQRLKLAPDSGIEAFEDTSLLMLSEQKQPLGEVDEENVDPDAQAERARVARALDRGLDSVVAYVLPLKAASAANRKSPKWVTERWQLRRDKLVLLPGDSPAGFRLPLASLPQIPAADFPHVYPLDPMTNAPPLREPEEMVGGTIALVTKPAKAKSKAPAAWPIDAVRTALVIEPRDGKLCIFMPPLESVDDYAALLACIEDTAKSLGTPVHIEGYAPPYDPRFQVLKVTPDPGVIEVNVQPAATWEEIVANTTALYDDAHAAGLQAEKFMLDGKHTGTGGGNHIVLGGMSPTDSPFLRRPDVLASIIAYWQNHPSLSYLFAGLFIGPTSQAPRADEARFESIYELEIALSQVPHPSVGTVPPWLVDRLFRNLLIDVTGNTHRAEICIDKLYSSDSSTGRLGLVEFRSFEMPPHARMSLAQQLLVRALIAMFWETPYRRKLVRWGTALHDKFMLPHYLWADLEAIVDDLKASGLPVDIEWFRPHLDFRFPRFGAVEYANTQVELRQALEPWHVLGEENSGGGTARYVDSSLERVQVKVSGFYGDRLTVTCNGRALPLTPTGTQGEAVAGIRYRAWAPPSALHPNIPVHTPLVIDVFDTWSRRAVAGCRYHVSHPGGRNYETFPINGYEAEGRRLTRFEAHGHTAGTFDPGPVAVNVDYPHTLDLRRPH
ncbi:MAG TPA: transglutaminase family protein [Hyphomicrobium sp.]|nr:transglutaminase family protein [Hyphomicrobium sp.]